MMRTAVGAWVLILVVVGLVVSSSLFGPDPSGTAVRQSPPEPPAVGTCVTSYDNPEIVPCDTVHIGEVVRSWVGADPASGSSDPLDHCWKALADYLGDNRGPRMSLEIDWWWPVPSNSPWVIRGPGHDRTPDWSWSACILVPQESPVAHSMRGLSDPREPRPSDWRYCGSTPDVWTGLLPCTEPHRFELIASGIIGVIPPDLMERAVADAVALGRKDNTSLDLSGVIIDYPAAATECRSLVELHLGGPRPDGESGLRSILAGVGFAESSSSDGVLTSRSGLVLNCVVEVVGDPELVDSVAGIGSGPLPYG